MTASDRCLKDSEMAVSYKCSEYPGPVLQLDSQAYGGAWLRTAMHSQTDCPLPVTAFCLSQVSPTHPPSPEAHHSCINVPQKPIAGARSPRNIVECACFNGAHSISLALISQAVNGEMALIIEFLGTVDGDIPTRSALHGTYGVGKSQVSYALARDLYDKGWYRHIFWMQATTIEKLHQGFSRLESKSAGDESIATGGEN